MIRICATFLLLVSGITQACECSQSLTYDQYAANASIIFIGQLVRAEIVSSENHVAEFTFDVTEGFKGIGLGPIRSKRI